ncbi:hypothetical protein DICVIV_06222 [Dictyocaulus viviparus]|uniref:RPGRIP1 C-terminal domain-containing protein n=1 Tax=Dictyocaulus viviparus TaxID=29172 RepID=A0A0D8XSW6_DICVI|nr:hypothetical protein DICVIV_06222 [Dictyocaulus viviparus]
MNLITSRSPSPKDNFSPTTPIGSRFPTVSESSENSVPLLERKICSSIETVSLGQTLPRSIPEYDESIDLLTSEKEEASSSFITENKPSDIADTSIAPNQSDSQSDACTSGEAAPSREENKNSPENSLEIPPPVAKPRFSKTRSTALFEALSKVEVVEVLRITEVKELTSLCKIDAQRDLFIKLSTASTAFARRSSTIGSEQSVSIDSTSASDHHSEENRQRTVAFTDPLHRSIPPSESSSISSPPPRPTVPLPITGGRSAIKVTKEQEEIFNMNIACMGQPNEFVCFVKEDSDAGDNRTVSIFIDRIYVPESSCLLRPSYDNVKVYVDWFFLDYPLEESRTPNAIKIPRIPDSPGIFAYKKEFQLTRRRVALLQQWLELGNRLDFTLVTDGDDGEELAVAQLELGQTGTDQTTTIQFVDVNGEHYADLDLVISYSSHIFDCLKV